MSKTDGITLKAYITGYVCSLALTVAAYVLVRYDLATKWTLVAAICALAIIQFLVQLIFFLHLGHEQTPRWKLLTFSFMIMVVVIVVGGSLWIMDNLNTHMSMDEMNKYMSEQDSL